MGRVFMSVILHDMLFDVFCDPAPPSRHSGHRAGKKHTEGAADTTRRHIGGARGAWLESVGLTVAAAGFSKGAACRTVERPAFPTRPGNPGPFLATRPSSTSSSPRPGSRYQGLFSLDRCARLRGCGFRGSKAVL